MSSVAFAQTQTTTAAAKPTQTIAQIAENNTNLTKLVSLLKKANLTDVLSGPGNYTVFAPDNAAFAKVNASTLANLQNNSTALTTLLLYHVIPTKLLENNFTGSGTSHDSQRFVPTLLGQRHHIKGWQRDGNQSGY